MIIWEWLRADFCDLIRCSTDKWNQAIKERKQCDCLGDGGQSGRETMQGFMGNEWDAWLNQPPLYVHPFRLKGKTWWLLQKEEKMNEKKKRRKKKRYGKTTEPTTQRIDFETMTFGNWTKHHVISNDVTMSTQFWLSLVWRSHHYNIKFLRSSLMMSLRFRTHVTREMQDLRSSLRSHSSYICTSQIDITSE